MARIWLASAALLGLSFVALLALSAHGPEFLSAVFGLRVPDLAGAAAAGKAGPALASSAPGTGGVLRLTSFEQALMVHGFHALALGLAALWIGQRGGLFAHLAALGFAAGTVLFAGTIYARALGEPVDPSLTPLGGTILLGAWAMFALAALFGGALRAGSAPRPAAAPRPAPRPAAASAATVFTGWAGSTPATPRPVPVDQPAVRQLRVETRHQQTDGSRRPVSGPPKRPTVSR